MIQGNDHVVVLVADIEAGIASYRKLGLTLSHRATVEAVSIHQAFFLLPEGGFIELIAPANGSSPLQKALDKQGEGLHTLAIKVENIDASVAAMQAEGVEVIGAGTDQVFVHPRSAHGVRIQLWDQQRPHRWQDNPSES